MKQNDKKMTIEDLARMVQNGFIEVNKSFDILEDGQNVILKRLNILEQAVLDIKLRQDNVPYRFELLELDKRVTKLEQRQKSI